MFHSFFFAIFKPTKHAQSVVVIVTTNKVLGLAAVQDVQTVLLLIEKKEDNLKLFFIVRNGRVCTKEVQPLCFLPILCLTKPWLPKRVLFRSPWFFFFWGGGGMEGSSCFWAKPIGWKWIPPRRPQVNWTFCWAVLWRTKIWLDVNADLHVVTWIKKFVARSIHIF